MIKINSFGSKCVNALAKNIKAEAHLAGGLFLLEEKILNNLIFFTCKLNSPEANYEVSPSKKKETTKHIQTKCK
jgi:hypothetical protein